MKIPLAILAAILILMPAASAACMTTGDIMLLMDMQDKLNITDDRLVMLFNTLVCNRTYDRQELDGKLEAYDDMTDLKMEIMDAKIDSIDYSDIDERVDNAMQNYTEWFEDEIGLDFQRQMLIAIYNNTRENITVPKINDSDLMRISDYESRLEDIEQDILDNKNRLNNPYSTTGYVPYNSSDSNWMAWAGGILIVTLIAAFVLNSLGILKIPRKHQHIPVSTSDAPARGIDERQTIANAKRDRAREFAKQLKMERLQKDMKECQKLDDKKERDETFAALEKELEALTEDDN
jgi:hypothetical protein